MNKLHKLDLLLDIVFLCISVVRICIGIEKRYDYIVVVFATVFLIYEISRAVKNAKNNSKTEKGY